MASKVNRSGQVDMDVPATPGQVWAVLTDVTRIGEWSHECHTAQWLDGADRAAIGAEFRGSNEIHSLRWSKKCTITDLQPARRFVYETHGSLKDPGATRWTFTLEPTTSGSHLTQAFQIIKLPKIAERIIAKKAPEHIDRTAALREDLQRLATVAAKTPAATAMAVAADRPPDFPGIGTECGNHADALGAATVAAGAVSPDSRTVKGRRVMSIDVAVEQMSFDPPGPGSWMLDSTHFPRPWSRYQAELHPRAVAEGTRESFRRYGLLIGALQFAPVNDFAYLMVLPAPESEIPARIQTAQEVFERKIWREDLSRWEQVVKPAAIRAHLDLQAIDPDSLGTEELLAHLDRCREHQKRMIYQHHTFDSAAVAPMGDFMVHVAEWTGRPMGEALALTRGYAPESAGSSTALDGLVTAIRQSPDAQAALAPEARAEDALAWLRAQTGELGAAAVAYLELVGYRLLDSLDTGDPYALEVPEVLVAGIRLAVSDGEPRSSDASAQEVARVRDLVPTDERDEFDALLAEARLTSGLRDERGLYSEVWAGGITRRVILAAGARLAADGRLDEPAHLVEAGYAEIRSLITGKAGPSAGELAQRAHYRATCDASTAPAFLGEPPQPPPPLDGLPPAAARGARSMGVAMDALFGASELASEPALVRGIGASSGIYEGTARLIRGPREFGHLTPGDILVTASTTEAFNVVLSLVGAIVTDRGGLLSHAAIVSRECGIPSVVGCQDATALITDGARVRVDGDKGEIVLLTP